MVQSLQLKRATRQKVKIRMSIASPTGFGKTHSALQLAYGMTGDWEKIALIDSENGSGDLYADLGAYNTITLEPPFSPDKYIEAIKMCEDAGMEVIIIDSATHVWSGQGGLLEFKDSLGGKFQDWAKVTPMYQAWLNAILHSKCHTITTMRKKQAYNMTIVNGATKVEKTGLDDQIRDGFDYEMTIAFEIINDAHLTQASKDRTRLFANKAAFVITPETGQQILEWCEIGEDIVGQVASAIEKLEKCNNVDELKLLKETLPMMVRTHQQFRDAGNARYAELAPAAPPTTNLAAEQTPAITTPAASAAIPDQSAPPVTTEVPVVDDTEKLKAEIQAAETPEELTRLHGIVKGLAPDAKKSLSVTVTTKGKKMGWVPNAELLCWELAPHSSHVNPSEQQTEEPPVTETPAAPQEPELKKAGDAGTDKFALSDPNKALYDQLDHAKDADDLETIIIANKEAIATSGPLRYIRDLKVQEFSDAHILGKIHAAEHRGELLEIYKANMIAIQASESLTQHYEQAREKAPAAPSNTDPLKRHLKWFEQRVGQSIMIHGVPGKYSGPYGVDDSRYPAYLVKMQEDDGCTFSDIENQIPAGTKLD